MLAVSFALTLILSSVPADAGICGRITMTVLNQEINSPGVPNQICCKLMIRPCSTKAYEPLEIASTSQQATGNP